MTLIPFTLEAARQPGAKVVTRGRYSITQWHYEPSASPRGRIVAFVDGGWERYTECGGYSPYDDEHGYDLMIELLEPEREVTDAECDAWLMEAVKGTRWEKNMSGIAEFERNYARFAIRRERELREGRA